jgi:hypothetical protein
MKESGSFSQDCANTPLQKHVAIETAMIRKAASENVMAVPFFEIYGIGFSFGVLQPRTGALSR